MPEASATVSGINEGIRDVNAYAERKQQALKDTMALYGLKVESTAKRNSEKTKDRGHLQSSTRAVDRAGGWIVEVESDAGYAKYIEFGTDAHTAPVQAILEWARRKGLTEQEGWRVWGIIRHYPTPPRPFLEPALDEHRAAFVRDMRTAMEGA